MFIGSEATDVVESTPSNDYLAIDSDNAVLRASPTPGGASATVVIPENWRPEVMQSIRGQRQK